MPKLDRTTVKPSGKSGKTRLPDAWNTLEGHEAERRARTRAWAVDSAARVVSLVRDIRAGTLAPWLTLEDIRARARLVDVFALLADGHHDAAERRRRSIPRPRASLPPRTHPVARGLRGPLPQSPAP